MDLETDRGNEDVRLVRLNIHASEVVGPAVWPPQQVSLGINSGSCGTTKTN